MLDWVLTAKSLMALALVEAGPDTDPCMKCEEMSQAVTKIMDKCNNLSIFLLLSPLKPPQLQDERLRPATTFQNIHC